MPSDKQELIDAAFNSSDIKQSSGFFYEDTAQVPSWFWQNIYTENGLEKVLSDNGFNDFEGRGEDHFSSRSGYQKVTPLIDSLEEANNKKIAIQEIAVKFFEEKCDQEKNRRFEELPDDPDQNKKKFFHELFSEVLENKQISQAKSDFLDSLRAEIYVQPSRNKPGFFRVLIPLTKIHDLWTTFEEACLRYKLALEKVYKESYNKPQEAANQTAEPLEGAEFLDQVMPSPFSFKR